MFFPDGQVNSVFGASKVPLGFPEQGVGRFGTRDGNIIEVHRGQTNYTPPEAGHITDDEYNGR